MNFIKIFLDSCLHRNDKRGDWIPVSTGMTGGSAGMTGKRGNERRGTELMEMYMISQTAKK